MSNNYYYYNYYLVDGTEYQKGLEMSDGKLNR